MLIQCLKKGYLNMLLNQVNQQQLKKVVHLMMMKIIASLEVKKRQKLRKKHAKKN